MDDYVINEADIEKVLRYLKIHKPEKATRGSAIQLLEIMHGAAKKIAIKDPRFAETLEDALLELERDKKEISDENVENINDAASKHLLMGEVLTEELEKALAEMKQDEKGFSDGNLKSINSITSGDALMGRLCLEAHNSYEQGNCFAALVTIFIVAEQSIKRAVNMVNGGFSRAVIEAEEQGVINQEEVRLIDAFRFLRNRIFHEDQYSSGIVVEGVMNFFSEDDTMRLLYRAFSRRIFLLVQHLEISR